MTYRFLPTARAELDTAALWYERRATGLGDRFTDEVLATARRIAANPRGYGPVSPPLRRREVREARVRVFAFKVVYEVAVAEVVILSVIHVRSARQPWRRRRS